MADTKSGYLHPDAANALMCCNSLVTADLCFIKTNENFSVRKALILCSVLLIICAGF